MTIRAISILSLFSIVALLSSPAKASVTDDLKQIENKWMNAWKSHDFAYLNKLLADDYSSTDSTGEITDKKATIAEYCAPGVVVTSSKFSDIVVQSYGDTALVRGKQKLVAHLDKKDFSGNYAFMDVFVKKDGQWHAVASYAVVIK